MGKHIPAFALMPLEIFFNKPHPSLLLCLQDSNTWKVIILLLQEVKCDFIFRHAQLQVPRQQEELLANKPIYSLQ
jgi:hypothetical protein